MKKPPPGMKSMPLKPGETKSQYMDRVRATKPAGTTGPVRVPKDPGTGAPKPRGGVGGGVKGGMAPIDSGRGIPIPPKGGGNGVKPKVRTPRTPIRPGRPPGFGGMVKGKK